MNGADPKALDLSSPGLIPVFTGTGSIFDGKIDSRFRGNDIKTTFWVSPYPDFKCLDPRSLTSFASGMTVPFILLAI